MTVDELKELLATLPSDAKVVTDVGASMISGWASVTRATYIEKYNVVELFAEGEV